MKRAGLLMGLSVGVCAWGQEARVVQPARPAGESAAGPAGLLETRLPEVRFEDVPLEQALDWMAEQTDVNLAVRWQHLSANGIERDRPITLKARNIRMSQALWLLLNEAGGVDTRLAYQLNDNILVISTDENLSAEMVTKVYDVSDLLANIPTFTDAPRIDPAQALQAASPGGGQGTAAAIAPAGRGEPGESRDGLTITERRDELVASITSTLEPDSWAQNGGRGTIAAVGSRLIVRNSVRVHQLLGGVMGELSTPSKP